MQTLILGKWMVVVSICLCAFAFFFLTGKAHSQNSPERTGIIFADGFDTGLLSPGRLGTRWRVDKPDAVRITHESRFVHSGCCSMEWTALPGKNAGAMARVFFEPGYDLVHVRWYCKFDAHFDQGNLMHLNKLTASKSKWAATAGRRPDGFDFFRTSLDIWRDWGRNPPPGEPVFYSYFPFMKKDPKTGKYYGNLFRPRRKTLIKPDRWYCMEMMLKANMPGISTGEQAFWINGRLIGHFGNIVWRYAEDLKIDSFSIGLFVHQNRKVNRLWYDDIVVSTGYIGP
jgi:hypothetical protein